MRGVGGRAVRTQYSSSTANSTHSSTAPPTLLLTSPPTWILCQHLRLLLPCCHTAIQPVNSVAQPLLSE